MINEVIAWWQSKNIQLSKDLEIILNNFRVVFACNSNRIEGNTLDYCTTRDIFEGNPLINFSGTAREIFEVQNQKYAFDFILKSFEEHRQIDIPFILKLHRILLYGCYDDRCWKKGERPGVFKKHDYCVGISEVGASPGDVEFELQEILNEMQQHNSPGDVLIKTAYFHLVFETIHPFADGNGRVGRTLMNYYLLLNNYPPVIIFEQDRNAYYLVLEVFNRTGEISGFVKFLQEQAIKTWENRVNKVQPIKRLNSFLK